MQSKQSYFNVWIFTNDCTHQHETVGCVVQFICNSQLYLLTGAVEIITFLPFAEIILKCCIGLTMPLKALFTDNAVVQLYCISCLSKSRVIICLNSHLTLHLEGACYDIKVELVTTLRCFQFCKRCKSWQLIIFLAPDWYYITPQKHPIQE